MPIVTRPVASVRAAASPPAVPTLSGLSIRSPAPISTDVGFGPVAGVQNETVGSLFAIPSVARTWICSTSIRTFGIPWFAASVTAIVNSLHEPTDAESVVGVIVSREAPPSHDIDTTSVRSASPVAPGVVTSSRPSV
jgi:hypothetical protein